MQYLHTLRLFFDGGGVFNDYRLRNGRVEFCKDDGQWRVLDESEVQLHYALHTEVARWLREESVNANPHSPTIVITISDLLSERSVSFG